MNMKNGLLKIAVLTALVVPVATLPVAANAALQYTPPQAMVLTCNGTAPNVLGKTSALATFACANGQAPQAVGITSGMGGLLGLASGAAVLAASEAVPSLALPAMGGGSGANGSGNGSGSGAQSHGNGSSAGKGNGSNGSGNGNGNGSSGNGSGANAGSNGSGSGGSGSNAGNGSGSSGSGANAGGNGSGNGSARLGANAGSNGSASNGSGSGGGGWLGHLIHSVGQAAQQIGTAVVTGVASGTGSQATIPLFGGSGGQGTVAVGNNLAGGNMGTSGGDLFGGNGGRYSVPALTHYPAAGGTLSLLFDGTHGQSGQSSLWWLIKREIAHGGKLPYRYAVSMNRPTILSGNVVKTGPGDAFCEGASGSAADTFAPIQFEALTCRVEQGGQLAVFSSNNAVQFTVPRGAFSRAYTNLSGNNPSYFMQYTTGELRRTAGYVFPTQYLRASASFAKEAHWVRVFSSCVAGPVVHYRDGIPMIYQMPTYVTHAYTPPAQIHLSSMANPPATPAPAYHAPTPAEVAAANPACFGYMGYSPSALRAAGVVRTSSALGYATPEVLENGRWVASPYRARVVWTGPSRDNASIMRTVREALAADSAVSGKTLAQWGVPVRQTIVMGSSPLQ
jgi:hypothetical protein